VKRAAIVLCGGQSRRMGRPKALLPWFGRTMIEHVLATLEGCVDERIVVTSEALSLGALALAARIVVDREPARGPLAALRDGLEATTAEQVFVTACDSPFLTVEHVEALFDRARTGSGAAAPVDEGIVQVLSAVYPGGAGREAAALLAAGISSPTALLERIGFDAIGRDASGSAHARPGAAAAGSGGDGPRRVAEGGRDRRRGDRRRSGKRPCGRATRRADRPPRRGSRAGRAPGRASRERDAPRRPRRGRARARCGRRVADRAGGDRPGPRVPEVRIALGGDPIRARSERPVPRSGAPRQPRASRARMTAQ
jgi:molybdopterin-guanine dinucleotide biosynthesis protein A